MTCGSTRKMATLLGTTTPESKINTSPKNSGFGVVETGLENRFSAFLSNNFDQKKLYHAGIPVLYP